ncbi:26S proteasome non-ATPase regulatory subunit 10 [Phytophthora citrophthora]|uniref:26S proteasome non-ATPase regulatory subunit 10 n=1 Tax=Phytophthora citrophthora TaxID=4793 RepID=A0AAD9H156_9STRA|nr:26S proteasome non-ATPase regulatory subunit 10 [Phytophthora citrophthora]
MKKIRVRFLLGNVSSFVSLVLLLTANSGQKWAHDTVNSVDIGLWFLSGTGVRYKLINAGAAADSTDVTSAAQPFTAYRSFCSLSIVASNDPWCLGDATATRGFTVLALLAAIMSFIVSIMVAFDIKIPTWNGEGKEITLVTSIVCSLIETMALIPAVTHWQRMVNAYDQQCREEMGINTFICIETGSTYICDIAAIPFATATYLLWRLSHSYYEAKRAGRIADGFTLAAKTGKKSFPYIRHTTKSNVHCLVVADNVDEILSGIANKIDIDANGSDGRNALHWACTLHRTSICHVLLKKGASISKKDRDGWTPLHWASRVGNLDIVRLLAKYGANVNVQDRWGTTPLMLTVVGESKLAAETLIELGASVDARNVFGQTPLMQCAEGGTPLHQLGMVFLNAGSDLTLQDAQGMTALHYAAACGNVNLLMNMLQQCDAELVEKPNKFGETLVYPAVLHSHPKILDLIENWREGNPIVAIHDDSSEDGGDSTDTSEDNDSDNSSEEDT